MLKLKLEGRCYKVKNIEINSGITCLTGPNGSGKSYACKQLRDYFEENNIDYYMADIYEQNKNISQNYLENGYMKNLARWVGSSEGQRCYDTFIDNHAGRIGNYVRLLVDKGIDKGYIIIDGADSGVSIDLLISIRHFFDMIMEDSKESGIEMYLIITSNSYELVYDYDCIWIPNMKHYKRGYEADGYNLWRKEYEDVYKSRNKK